MSSMNVILKEDVPNLGSTGDVVKVKGGYARNYLIPQKKALLADSRNIKAVEHAKLLAEHALEKMKKSAEDLGERLKQTVLTVVQKAGEDDKLFGSVTSMDVEHALKAEGFDVDRKKIHLEKPLKQLGDFIVPVKLHRDVTINVTLKVVKE
ncbi:MAG: 50S ribosomal protein L9 [Deltaproteobacteria bacterium]|nr:50S ribosomal protein L9 [Deltaproteobacteria bacterium]